MSRTGESVCRAPTAIIWRRMTSAMSPTSSSSQVDARPIAWGNWVASCPAVAGDTFFVHHDRYPRRVRSHRDSLDLVHQARALAGCNPGRRADAGHVPHAVLEPARHVVGVEPVAAHEVGQPDTRDLRQLLVELMRTRRSSTRSVQRRVGSRYRSLGVIDESPLYSVDTRIPSP